MTTQTTITEGLPAWVTVAQCVEATQLAERTVRRWLADGTLTARRFGTRAIRIERDSIERAFTPLHD